MMPCLVVGLGGEAQRALDRWNLGGGPASTTRSLSFTIPRPATGAPSWTATWFLNMAKHRDDIWLEVGKERFKVRGESLEGTERTEALARIAAIAPRYCSYQEKKDREISIVRLTPEPCDPLARRDLPMTGTALSFRTRVVSSRLLTATTHAIQVEKPKSFAFRATPFTVLQLLTEAGVDVRPISLATGPTLLSNRTGPISATRG